ncbi:hypothetical protein BGP77_12335 [Saccharospirillum sp. MSK14-1]|uniref:hypothetical protein n=1 Tax=Saccharospirillum sp. MSK14-1 TaxID=1897632 RepID=UPI000D33B6EF|nr:hypothetical protein [Saccharospirillum sp. MSK14-1]PTY38489.1 hypothetical protein BGP77_12335 [Saccharospirillum sp. MSK14-1]
MTRFWLILAWGFQLVSLALVMAAIALPRLQPADEGFLSGTLLLAAAMVSAVPALIAELRKNELSSRVFRCLVYPAVGWWALMVLLSLVVLVLNLSLFSV